MDDCSGAPIFGFVMLSYDFLAASLRGSGTLLLVEDIHTGAIQLDKGTRGMFSTSQQRQHDRQNWSTLSVVITH